MVEFLKQLAAPLLHLDLNAPHVPAGHENDRYLRVVRASPRFLSMRYMLVAFYAIGFLLIIAAEMIGSLFVPFTLWWLTLLIAMFFGLKILAMIIVTRFDYDMRWYIITDTSLRVRYGVWALREITVSFGNVQNVRIAQGPVERLFDISTLIVETAGGGSNEKNPHVKSHQAILRGIENAKEIRDMIISILQQQKRTGLGDPDDDIEHHAKAAALPIPELDAIAAETQKLRQLFTSK